MPEKKNVHLKNEKKKHTRKTPNIEDAVVKRLKHYKTPRANGE